MMIKVGDKVIIHISDSRDDYMKSFYEGKVGEVVDIWDIKCNPWGNIHVRLDNGFNNSFLENELEKLPKGEELNEHTRNKEDLHRR